MIFFPSTLVAASDTKKRLVESFVADFFVVDLQESECLELLVLGDEHFHARDHALWLFAGSVPVTRFLGVLQAGSFLQEADCNQDGVVSFLDIQPLIQILSNG